MKLKMTKKLRLPRLTPSSVFLLLAIPFGLLAVVFVPPFEAPDEPAHFVRAYQISQGTFIASRSQKELMAVVPASIGETQNNQGRVGRNGPEPIGHWLGVIEGSGKIALNPSKTMEYGIPNTGLYSPVAYLPQAVMILPGRLLELPPVALLYLARLGSLIGGICLMYGAIRMARWGRWLLCLVGTLPMTVFLLGSVTSDTMATGMAMLGVAMLTELWYRLRNGVELTKKYYAALLLVSVGLALIKLPYGLVMTLVPVILLTTGGAKHTRDTWLRLGGVVAVAFVVMASWSLLSNKLFAPIIEYPIANAARVNPQEQMHYILTHLQNLPEILGNTYLTSHSSGPIVQLVGQFGWLSIALPVWCVVMVFVLLFYIYQNDTKPDSSKYLRWFAWALLLAELLLLAILLYMSWTPVGYRKALGLQGRYFIPLLPVLLFTFGVTKAKHNTSHVNPKIVLTVMAVALVTAASVVAAHYYLGAALLNAAVGVYGG